MIGWCRSERRYSVTGSGMQNHLSSCCRSRHDICLYRALSCCHCCMEHFLVGCWVSYSVSHLSSRSCIVCQTDCAQWWVSICQLCALCMLYWQYSHLLCQQLLHQLYWKTWKSGNRTFAKEKCQEINSGASWHFNIVLTCQQSYKLLMQVLLRIDEYELRAAL